MKYQDAHNLRAKVKQYDSFQHDIARITEAMVDLEKFSGNSSEVESVGVLHIYTPTTQKILRFEMLENCKVSTYEIRLALNAVLQKKVCVLRDAQEKL